MVQQTGDNKFGVAKWIVDSSGLAFGTHTTIASAIASASSGDTIFIRPGTYTEDLTLKAGVNIVAFMGDQSLPNVTIVGNATMNTAGSANISNIRLQTNGAAVLTVSGSAASRVSLNGCYINATNATPIILSSSSSNSAIGLSNCAGDLGTTGIKIYDVTGAGIISISNTVFANSGGSSTASTASSGTVNFLSTSLSSPITTSGTAALGAYILRIDSSAQNATCVTVNGSGGGTIVDCSFNSGTASSISIGSTSVVIQSAITSGNTNAITGAGTLFFSNLSFFGSSGVNTTTLSPSSVKGGFYQGNLTNTAIPAGMIGEEIRATRAVGSALALSNGVAANVASISLTPGVWSISGVMGFTTGGALTGTAVEISLSTTSATRGAGGDNAGQLPTMPVSGSSAVVLTIPSWVQRFSATTTVYLVGFSNFTAGGISAYGRISAIRIG